MIRMRDNYSALAAALILAALFFPLTQGLPDAAALSWFAVPAGAGAALVVLAGAILCAWRLPAGMEGGITLLALVGLGAATALTLLRGGGVAGSAGLGFWLFNLGLWALMWRAIDSIAEVRCLSTALRRLLDTMVPMIFGLWLLFLWEIATVGFGVPQVLLPAPSMIVLRIAGSLDILAADFVQTFMKAVISGYAIGCASGFIVAVLVDRVPFLQRGLLPLGNLASALPIVGVAPIMVMWFGFDWQSKAAVVVIMTFFPMLVNTVTGLTASGAQERELLRSYAASHWQTLVKLRLPAAMPFIFNALKINSTLALIGAIVAEFFGTPIVGMGFRISTEVGRLNVDMVWAEIVMAALAGTLFYGMVALAERAVTFWHPSYRQRQ